MKQQLGKLHYNHLGDFWYFSELNETFSISLIEILIMISFVDMVLILIESMIGETHWLDVSLGKEISHTFFIACSKGSMRNDMATTSRHLFFHDMGHSIDWIPYGDDFLSITYGVVWASLIHNVGERIFGDLVFSLPLEGNIIAAQDQKILYTYHKWRGGQCGVGYFVYHDQIFSPPTLQEPKVEKDFQDFPCWEVTQFIWMIAWGWRITWEWCFPLHFRLHSLRGPLDNTLLPS